MERRLLGRSEQLAEGGSLRFRVAVEGREVEAFAVRHHGIVRAYLNVCSHRAVELDLGSGSFFLPDGSRLLCRAHGAQYEPETGLCTSGPCPKGSMLTSLPVTEHDGGIWLG